MSRPHLTEVAPAATRGAYWRPRPALAPLSHVLRELAAIRGMLTASAGALDDFPATGARAGAPVLLVPGFLAGDRSLEPLAAYLAGAGYGPRPAGIARNLDCSETTTGALTSRLERLVGDHGAPIAIVGHSRGGMLARVIARRRPDLVSAVIALATPQREPLALHPMLLGPALALAGAGSAGIPGLVRYSCIAGQCCTRFRADLAAPVPAGVGYLSIFSRRDAIVDWRACEDPDGRHVEITSSHCGMAADPVALHLVAGALDGLAHRRAHTPALAA